jgi:hypothetical protein
VDAINGITAAERRSAEKSSAAFRRMAIDVRIQIGLGRFFATKLRAGALYAIYQQSGDRAALETALNWYRQARELWSQFAAEAKAAYVSDITYGPLAHQRGDWQNRLAAMDIDIVGLEKQLASLPAGSPPSARVKAAIEMALGRPERTQPTVSHMPSRRFIPGEPLDITFEASDPAPKLVRLHYRHVNQSERYQVVEMIKSRSEFRVAIPAAYTNSKYPLQYYFEVDCGTEGSCLYPAFDRALTVTPYFVVHSA